MPATMHTTTLDPCERVFAAVARPDCETCQNTGMVTMEDDDGHESGYRTEEVPCWACEAGDDAAWWQAVDEAVQWHRDEAAMLVASVGDDWSDDEPPF